MKAESELEKHHFWHALFERKMGTFTALAQNEKNGEVCRITRLVRYCRLCRVDFHEGEAIKDSVRKAVNLPPELKPLPQFMQNVFQLGASPSGKLPSQEDQPKKPE